MGHLYDTEQTALEFHPRLDFYLDVFCSGNLQIFTHAWRALPVPPVDHSLSTNRLLEGLPHGSREQLLSGCELVDLPFGEILAEPGSRIRHIYFPTHSFISLIARTDDHVLETGLIGDEGMFGISLALGVDLCSLRVLVQGAGPALRMQASSFIRELDQNIALQRALKYYIFVVISQLTQTVICNHFHRIETRLARWLLMMQDRAHSDEFHVTHEFLAYVLGVRRAGVTKAATSLQLNQLIRYKRGDITILDRIGLENSSCNCYETDKTTYDRIMV
ncbi:hypothetical protein FEMY_21310 [Ferrovum myxofaciens]|uniref:Cyclic nucleotide-binding domain-containing protein n=1 Tax=Ferrovum myxofaciens TaxID=416213 RepID=A0A149VVU4_9PROT|nr:hypothetical protein FEMY_21310 [Ferrovum myxofaciens]